ncbi:hypothetical protein ACC771_02795, partial [Rhizobium ruizarguesonis]
LGFGGGGKCAVQQISTLEGFTERRLDVILLTLLEESRFCCGRFWSHGQFEALRRLMKNRHSVLPAFRANH